MPTNQVTTEYRRVVEELGYDLSNQDGFEGASGFFSANEIKGEAKLADRRFRYDAVLNADKLGVTDIFELNGAPCIYFKSLAADPSPDEVRSWHRTAWNHGLGRMLWIVTPSSIQVLNAYKPPADAVGEAKHPAELLRVATDDLERLREFELDRIGLETGQFWDTTRGRRIKKSERIDTKLAQDLAKAGEILVDQGCDALAAHRLMLRTMFTAYLESRGVLPSSLFDDMDVMEFCDVLKSTKKTKLFFERMRDTFNGDLFPPPPKNKVDRDTYTFAKKHLDVARRIVEREDLKSRQQSFDFWRYDFEVIPIELISSIYERFIYADDEELAKKRGTHYTPVNLVDLVFSQVFDDALFESNLPTKPKVLDLACGSGVFLVEAYRRLVARRVTGGEKLNRTLVRDVLENQLFGVDLEETAIEIAAFSLCLTAFELDPSPSSVNQLRFRRSLKGRNLFAADAFEDGTFAEHTEFKSKQFSIVVGNPPWNKPLGARSTRQQSLRSHIDYCASQEPPIELPFRSPVDQAFVWRGRDFAKKNARFGMIIDGKNFFSQEEQSLLAQRNLYRAFATREIINLAALHDKGLFPSAKQPAIVLVAENAKPASSNTMLFVSAERSESFRQHGVIELNSERAHQLPMKKLAECSHLLKIASFGTARDLAIVTGLESEFGTLTDYLEELGTELKQGFILGTRSRQVPLSVQRMPMLENRVLDRWVQRSVGLPKMEHTGAQWPRSEDIYRAPVCLLKQSLQENRLVASVSNSDLCYSRTYFGVPLVGMAEFHAKTITAYINSSLAAYCYFLTSTRFGIDKQIVEQNDFARLPFRRPEKRSDCERLIREFDRRVKTGDTKGFDSLDKAVFDYFEIDDWDREYITDVVKFDLDFARSGAKSDAVLPASDEIMLQYADSLCEAIRANLVESDVVANVELVAELKDVRAVVINFDGQRKRKVRISRDGSFVDGRRLANLLHAPISSSVQSRRSLLLFDDEQCVVVKHAQSRFWSRARAQDDADSIFDRLLQPVG